MKKIILVIYITIFSFAYEEPVSDQTAFEVLLFKTGVTSLTKDFELEKENIANNTKEIKALKKEVQFLLQENLKLKLQTKNSDTTFESENQLLKKELERLQKKLDKENTPETQIQNTQDFILAKVYDTKASSINAPFPNAKKVTFYTKDSLLQLEWCNKYGWCKILSKEEYIAQYKLYFIETKDIK